MKTYTVMLSNINRYTIHVELHTAPPVNQCSFIPKLRENENLKKRIACRMSFSHFITSYRRNTPMPLLHYHSSPLYPVSYSRQTTKYNMSIRKWSTKRHAHMNESDYWLPTHNTCVYSSESFHFQQNMGLAALVPLNHEHNSPS